MQKASMRQMIDSSPLPVPGVPRGSDDLEWRGSAEGDSGDQQRVAVSDEMASNASHLTDASEELQQIGSQ